MTRGPVIVREFSFTGVAPSDEDVIALNADPGWYELLEVWAVRTSGAAGGTMTVFLYDQTGQVMADRILQPVSTTNIVSKFMWPNQLSSSLAVTGRIPPVHFFTPTGDIYVALNPTTTGDTFRVGVIVRRVEDDMIFRELTFAGVTGAAEQEVPLGDAGLFEILSYKIARTSGAAAATFTPTIYRRAGAAIEDRINAPVAAAATSAVYYWPNQLTSATANVGRTPPLFAMCEDGSVYFNINPNVDGDTFRISVCARRMQ